MHLEHPRFWNIFVRPSRLGRKFLRAFLAASLLPLLLMGGMSVYLVNSIHRLDIAIAEQSVAAEKAAEIGRVVEELFDLLEVTVAFEEFAPIAA